MERREFLKYFVPKKTHILSADENDEFMNLLNSKKLTRREFGAASGAIGVMLALIENKGEAIVNIKDAISDWQTANRPNSELLENERLNNLQLGASFAPERYRQFKKGDALSGFKLITKELNIKNIRLGIRANSVSADGSDINFSYYTPFLEEAFSQNMQVCLNVGPIKVFGFPEIHLPEKFIEKAKSLPPQGSVIGNNEQIAQLSLEYLDKLLNKLDRQFGKSLSKVKTIQADNEHNISFGNFGWTTSPDYLENQIDLIKSYFPNANVLVNSGRSKLTDGAQFLDKFSKRGQNERGNLTLGLDYYHEIPDILDAVPGVRHVRKFFDPFVTHPGIGTAEIWEGEREVTELQAEPWPPYKGPGNSPVHFRYALLRGSKFAKNIRVWGLERLAGKMFRGDLTENQIEILNLIKAVNNRIG